MPIDPKEDYIQQILASNAAWAADLLKTNPEFFTQDEWKQKPHTLWIGCADSRVSESVIPDIQPGDIFVHRNIANQLQLDDKNALSVLQFAVDVLQVPHVFIVDHTRCGGVTKALSMARDSAPIGESAIPIVNQWLKPLAEVVRTLLPTLEGLSDEEAERRLVYANVKAQVNTLACTETIKSAWARGQSVGLHGFVYHLETGKLEPLTAVCIKVGTQTTCEKRTQTPPRGALS